MVRLLIAAVFLVVAQSICDAFCLAKSCNKNKVSFVGKSSVVRLCAAAADEPEWETKEPSVAEEEKQQPSGAEEEQLKETEEPREDPEMVALKQEIANLESALKAKQNELSYQEEQLDYYSKAGYARKVAEMETMRRSRSVRVPFNCFLAFVCENDNNVLGYPLVSSI
jgi:glucan-binding YG repeat protein